MATMYAEQLYVFMSKQGKDFNNDPDIIRGQSMKTLVDIFRINIIPTLTEAFLISKCESIVYN